ncbi:hypothetical protein BCR44DRAFT_1006098 [Catenaria anguillulae PL171]|uniref:J domain-containing protein n=1 Tax=Catenaria anguillulae PL171 TaxID=765915 RepID=A0A1Y2I7C9_9FUNG|nr:hypothetical protein BCR44DRAFT_1006098 [Catenaria anguillulae PL171]
MTDSSASASSAAATATLLKDYDLSIDYYALIGVEPGADAAALRKGYRTMSLQLHPDKNRDNPNAANEFQAVKRAFDMLSNDALREAYDSYLKQQRAHEERIAQLGAAKRKMRDDLEERERAAMAKRAKPNQVAILNRAATIERLRHENNQLLRSWIQDLSHRSIVTSTLSSQRASAAIPADHRTVRVRWLTSRYPNMSDTYLQDRMQSAFGPVEHVLLKVGPELGTAVVQFARIASALDAVKASVSGHNMFVSTLESVTWAMGKEPPLEYLAAARDEGNAKADHVRFGQVSQCGGDIER